MSFLIATKAFLSFPGMRFSIDLSPTAFTWSAKRLFTWSVPQDYAKAIPQEHRTLNKAMKKARTLAGLSKWAGNRRISPAILNTAPVTPNVREGTFFIGGGGPGLWRGGSFVNILQIVEGQTCFICNRGRVIVFWQGKNYSMSVSWLLFVSKHAMCTET